MHRRVAQHLNTVVGRWLPEQRLFLKSDNATRFVRLRPLTQAVMLTGTALIFGWSVVVSSILLSDVISAGSSEEQVARAQAAFEGRLDELSHERDARADEAAAAQSRFSLALQQVSLMQSALLASEERRRELETGIDVIQSTLRRTMQERDAASAEVALRTAELNGQYGTAARTEVAPEDVAATLDIVAAALSSAAAERARAAAVAVAALQKLAEMQLEQRLLDQRNDEIFATLENAVSVSVGPLDKMFRAVGMDADAILETVRLGYSGTGGPLLPVAMSASGATEYSADLDRANGILDTLDRLNLYRIAAASLPLDTPVRAAYRLTSPFGRRWGTMHEGIDMAGPTGTPIYTSGDGVVVFAGWQAGYGNMIEIRHQFGTSTRYGHLSKIRITVGQKVSRGDRIGDMGSTGRSSGPHLHYEVHVSGKPVNPMTFIKAASNVF
ncbi:M23 family metallopeptidase [Phaeovulum sp.]|uniref:M23 family metallopeptidase n=1 Tax=Phaeovulum sp. TaxID=2934796 RepID=UPI002ABC0152|nr:M23 family metallopeptidase [Phaeovulum sp.]MDZ4118306.1 M23 family metallopeptidase [Phaeovulum sp.]